MEQTNLPIVAKKLWNTVRIMFYMIKEGIIKRKLMLDLKLMITRGKIASKALHNLMFHHAHHSIAHFFNAHLSSIKLRDCNKQKQHSLFFNCTHEPVTDDDMTITNIKAKKALEMMECYDVAASPTIWHSAVSSPAMLEFRKHLAPRKQVRITDSPFPMHASDGDCHVDEAAAEFIANFYSNLRRQSTMSTPIRV